MGVRVYPLGQGAITALRNEERGKRVPQLRAASSQAGVALRPDRSSDILDASKPAPAGGYVQAGCEAPNC